MIYSLDIGGSTADLVVFDTQKKRIHSFIHEESTELKNSSLREMCEIFGIVPQVLEEKKIRVTGGTSNSFPDTISISGQDIEVIKIHEFEALATGARFLSGEDSGLAVSMGTGTAMVSFTDSTWKHVKGTGVGGGSFIGLGKAMLGLSSFHEISELAEKGSSTNINLSVSDIVGGGIGELSGDMTASHFAKYSNTISHSDIAFGIASLVAESITALAIEKAMRLGHEKIIAGGKFSQLTILQEQMSKTAKRFGISVVFPEYSHCMTAVGAALSEIS